MMHSLQIETQKSTLLSSAPSALVSRYTTSVSPFATNFVTARYAQNLLTLGLDPTLKECITMDHRSSAEPTGLPRVNYRTSITLGERPHLRRPWDLARHTEAGCSSGLHKIERPRRARAHGRGHAVAPGRKTAANVQLRRSRRMCRNVRNNGENRLISFKEYDSVRHSGYAWNHERVDFGA
jgi:hypothetical protein